jgi:hypothetical protein
MNLRLQPCLLAMMLAVLVAPSASAVTRTELDELTDSGLDGLLARQLPWGGFDDPLAGPRFNYGAVALGWLAAERAAPGAAGDPRRRAADASLLAATRVAEPGAFQVWIEALALQQRSASRLAPGTRAALADHLQRFTGPITGAAAAACAADSRCYSNLKLVDAVAMLELARAGIGSARSPASVQQTERILIDVVPRVQRPELRLRAGAVAVGDAAILSDPSRNPLAYHALSCAMVVRAIRLLDNAPAPTRRAAHRALWALVALADPLGDVTWMGRGTRLVWTYGASVYAGLAGAAEFAADDPALAARLRRLADLAFAELRARLGPAGLALGPGPRRTLAGLDHSADTIVYNGLALTFLQLAIGEADAAAGLTAPLPAEVPGARVLDPNAAGVAAIRSGRVWFAVHRAVTHPRDARYDAGLVAAMMRERGGWRPLLIQRPNTHGAPKFPSSGPLLVVGGRTLVPSGVLDASGRAITLTGAWRGGGLTVRARWRFDATRDGVRLRTPCPRGARLGLVEWVPGDRPHAVGVRFDAVARMRAMRGAWASAAFERLRAVRIESRCTGRPVTITWRER